jgi:hypothetical protein
VENWVKWVREKLEGKVKEYIGFEKGGKVMVVEKAHAKPAKVFED